MTDTPCKLGHYNLSPSVRHSFSTSKALLNILRKIFRLWKTRHGRHFGRYQKSIEKLKKGNRSQFLTN